MPRELVCEISVIDFPLFARLVAFVEEVDAYASEECDLALKDRVENCREDMARFCGGEDS
jgi:hypothetical protein